jgi:hypothetical protein
MTDKFTWKPGDVRMNVPRQCSNCTHLRDGKLWTCDAFPRGIPAAILTNQFDHTKAFPGDHGIRFEPKEVGS